MPLKRDRHTPSQLPEINLIPMMDVLMTVLTFFIIISMTLTGQQLFNIDLPLITQESPEAGGEGSEAPQKLTLGIDAEGNVVMTERMLTQEELVQEVSTFLSENPGGIVVLKADRQLKFNGVTGVLNTLRDIGGDRVFLGIEQGS